MKVVNGIGLYVCGKRKEKNIVNIKSKDKF